MNYKQVNDYEIMYLVEEKSEEASSLLFEKYQPIIDLYVRKYRKFCFRLGIDADDLIQEGRIGLWNAITHYIEYQGNMFYTFACICVEGKIQNLVRSAQRQKHQLLNESISLYAPIDENDHNLLDVVCDPTSFLPENYFLSFELEDKLRQFALSLGSSESSVFSLKLSGFHNYEIADLLAMPPTAVANRLYRVRNKLRNYLAKD